jgi:hypothetical protein
LVVFCEPFWWFGEYFGERLKGVSPIQEKTWMLAFSQRRDGSCSASSVTATNFMVPSPLCSIRISKCNAHPI